MKEQIRIITAEMSEMRSLFSNVVEIIPPFDIADPDILPYGLKPHTRSVSWIIEQVITQQAKHKSKMLDIDDVDIDLPDTSLHDCIVHKGGNKYFVNVKITGNRKRRNKNDIAAVEKLYTQYKSNSDYRLIYMVFGFEFKNTTITLDKDLVHAFSPQFLPIYVNPRNDKIQSTYYAEQEIRSRKKFLELLKTNSRNIKLP